MLVEQAGTKARKDQAPSTHLTTTTIIKKPRTTFDCLAEIARSVVMRLCKLSTQSCFYTTISTGTAKGVRRNKQCFQLQ
jgi:hypothetical protein